MGGKIVLLSLRSISGCVDAARGGLVSDELEYHGSIVSPFYRMDSAGEIDRLLKLLIR